MTNRKQKKLVCNLCGKTFNCRSDHHNLFCSRKCAGKSRRKKPKKCLYCGKYFISKYHHNIAIFCSNKCAGKSRRRRKKYNCVVCNKIIERTESHIYNKNTITCSKKCRGICSSILLRGEFSSNWKGAKASYIGVHSWVIKNFKDEKECEICGEKNKKLNWCRKDHNKLTRDRKDWMRLCVSCHRIYDYNNNNYAPKGRK